MKTEEEGRVAVVRTTRTRISKRQEEWVSSSVSSIIIPDHYMHTIRSSRASWLTCNCIYSCLQQLRRSYRGGVYNADERVLIDEVQYSSSPFISSVPVLLGVFKRELRDSWSRQLQRDKVGLPAIIPNNQYSDEKNKPEDAHFRYLQWIIATSMSDGTDDQWCWSC